MGEELLEKIRKLTECRFISDIKLSISKRELFYYLKEERLDDYCLKEWEEVCNYLFEEEGNKVHFENENDLAEYLN